MLIFAFRDSRARYAFSFAVDALVVALFYGGAACLPLALDWQTGFHVAFALVYLQANLLVARGLAGPGFGAWSLPRLILPKLSPLPDWAPVDGPALRIATTSKFVQICFKDVGKNCPVVGCIGTDQPKFLLCGCDSDELGTTNEAGASVGVTPPGFPPLARSMLEIVASTFHETWWCVLLSDGAIR